jgi:hypothetical protein
VVVEVVFETTFLPLVIVTILCLSVFTQSLVGFGQAMLAMPLITLLLDVQTATALVALVGIVSTMVIVLRGRQQINLREGWRLMLATLVGVPFGLLLLTQAPHELVTGLLGLLLIGFSLYNLLKWQLPQLPRENLAFAFGFTSGVLGGAYNTSAPPLVVYGVLRRWLPTQFPATLQGISLPLGCAVVASHGVGGLWTQAVLGLFVPTLPLIPLCVLLGLWLNQRVPRARFEQIIYLIILLLGLLLLAG